MVSKRKIRKMLLPANLLTRYPAKRG